jgi:hypothetical protein
MMYFMIMIYVLIGLTTYVFINILLNTYVWGGEREE